MSSSTLNGIPYNSIDKMIYVRGNIFLAVIFTFFSYYKVLYFSLLFSLPSVVYSISFFLNEFNAVFNICSPRFPFSLLTEDLKLSSLNFFSYKALNCFF